ncbi:MAG TPA: phosphate ABC transporter permease PstA [Caulobacteraceae bacterium]|jgi:phosphate transport system permease protein
MTSLRRTRRTVANVAFTGFCYVGTAIALAALALIFWTLMTKGIGGINANVFVKETPAAGSVGGLANAIIGSVVLCALAMAIAITVGVLAGTWLAEFGGNTLYAEIVRFVNDILLSAPSVLVGLFVYSWLVKPFHGFSAFAGAVALALIAVPIITRTTEDVLKLQPTALRESGVALGTPHWTTIRKILWKSAGSGILTGGLLAFARISGETAPLLFTALNNQFFSVSLHKPWLGLNGSIASLPAVIFQFALSAYDDLVNLAWAGALIIAVAVLAANILARFVTRERRSA